jgi:hypothetical protein
MLPLPIVTCFRWRVADRAAECQGGTAVTAPKRPIQEWYVQHPGLSSRGQLMANKDKGGSKSSKTAASKSLKEKRQAKKAKVTRSGGSSMGASTNR